MASVIIYQIKMEYTSTTHGRQMIIERNFLYVFQKELADGVQSWECQLRRKQQCKARIKVLNNEVIERVNEHQHAPNSTKVQSTKIRVSMKRRAETTIDPPQRILSDGLAQATPAVAINLPRIPHIRRAIRRHRAIEGYPANPVDRASIPIIPNEFATTERGDRFLFYDSGVGDENRILLFATDQALDLLRSSDNWFGDGTFDVSPEIFFQVYTIHAICHGKVVPCMFGLLPNKQEATYNVMMRELNNHLNGHSPTDILFDFERAAMNSAENTFPGVRVHGCFFHLSKHIWKHIQRNGLSQLYENNDNFALYMRMIPATAFVDTPDVPQAFYDLETEIRNNFGNQNGVDAVLDYFEDTYIGRQRRGRPRAQPMFLIELWNMYDRTLEELPRTNNEIEGWHNRFNGNCDGSHPTLWKLLKSFKREESLVRAEIFQLIGGHPVVQKRKYADCAARVLNIVEDYPQRLGTLSTI